MLSRLSLCVALAAVTSLNCAAQKFVANYDESKIPAHTLPDPLVTEAGKPVTSATDWNDTRRPELVKLFQQHVYGRGPAAWRDYPQSNQHQG